MTVFLTKGNRVFHMSILSLVCLGNGYTTGHMTYGQASTYCPRNTYYVTVLLFVYLYVHTPLAKTIEWAPMSQRRVNLGFGKVIQHKLGWLRTWWMVQNHFSFILSWWYIIICCEKRSPRYRSLDKAGTVKDLKYQGHVRPIKWSELDDGWLIDNDKLTRFYQSQRADCKEGQKITFAII